MTTGLQAEEPDVMDSRFDTVRILVLPESALQERTGSERRLYGALIRTAAAQGQFPSARDPGELSMTCAPAQRGDLTQSPLREVFTWRNFVARRRDPDRRQRYVI